MGHRVGSAQRKVELPRKMRSLPLIPKLATKFATIENPVVHEANELNSGREPETYWGTLRCFNRGEGTNTRIRRQLRR